MDNNNMYNNDERQQSGIFTGAAPDPHADTQNQGYGYDQPNGYPQGKQGYQYPPQGGYQPELEEPMSVGEWLITLLLTTFVPCVNIVLMFVWAFSKKEKKSKSNFFKAQLIIAGVVLAIYILVMLIVVIVMGVQGSYLY